MQVQARSLSPRFSLPRKVANCQDPLPQEGHHVLETLVMTAEETEALARADADFDINKLPKLERLSIELAVYTSFCKLLSLHLHALEGPEGSGTLDSDVAIIAQGPASVSADTWNCVVYRAGQKRIVREYLSLANDRMGKVTTQMKALMQEHSEPAAR